MKLSSPEARAGSAQLTRALWLIFIALIAACFLRFPDRWVKPMHVDESTQAVKLHQFLEGEYEYDPVDHHGPALIYSTVPVMALTGTRWTELTESRLRLVPVLQGMALLVLLVLAADGLSRMALGWSALFIAVSPVMVFYSRYYIMETLLALFTFGCIGCGWRFFMTRQTKWVAAAGVCAGLMHVTKETCVLHFAAMGAALLVVWVAEFFSAGAGLGVVNRHRKSPVTMRHGIIFAGSAAAASLILFSQFFTEWRGVWDSIATYFHMLDRSGGQGHEKPFAYYAELLWGGPMVRTSTNALGFSWPGFDVSEWLELFAFLPSRRLLITERALMLLAVVGCLAAFTAKPARNQSNQFVRFMAIYGVVTFLIYSLIRYKTPWCIIGAWHALLIMAGLGAATITGWFAKAWARRTAGALILLAALHLAFQSWRVTHDFAADSRNPYNYSMTSPEALNFVRDVRRMAELTDGGAAALRIRQYDANGAWPLPWYLLRGFPKYQWEESAVDVENADILLLSTAIRDLFPQDTPQDTMLRENFVSFPVTLTPGVAINAFINSDLWKRFQEERTRGRWPADEPAQQ